MSDGSSQEEALPRDFAALAKITMAMRRDVARHEDSLYGGQQQCGLVQVGEETRKGMRELTELYLTDRDKAVEFYREVVEPERQQLTLALRRMFALACMLGLINVGLLLATLARVW